MTADALIKGWCPSLLSPMQSGDGWLARVKPTGARLSAASARLIADAARRHGNGHIDLTNRANLQIRGLSSHSAEGFAEAIIAEGLAKSDPAAESVRNVMASPLGPRDDATANFDSHALAHDIEAMLGEERALQALPSKFGFLVDGGGSVPLAGTTADIMVTAHRGQLAVSLDGGALAVLRPASTLVETVRAMAAAFLSLAAGRAERPRRMRALVMAVGEEAIFAAANLAPIRLPSVQPVASRSPIGFMSLPGTSKGAFGAGLPFGRIEAETLRELADLSERFGDGTLRLTPWRALLIARVDATDLVKLGERVGALGLIIDASDPRLRLHACVGAPACASASVDARTDAGRIAASAAAKGLNIHVSGCAKGCAHAGPASLTLVGRDSRYDVVRQGRAGDTPVLTGLNLEQVIEQVLALLDAERRPGS